MKILLLLLLLQIFSSFTFGQELPKPVKVELISDINSISSENEFKLGVLFKIDKGWHIYWKNPGDSGLPTNVEFTLPDGLEASELLWPLPVSFKRPEDVSDYGYEDEVLLWSEVKVKTKVDLSSDISMVADVSWVSCEEELCIPGKASLRFDGHNVEEGNKVLFKKWEKLLPKEEIPFISINIEEREVNDRSSEFVISIYSKKKIGDLEWFPDSESAVEVEDISYYLDKNSKDAKIKFIASVFPGRELSSDRLESLLVFKNASDVRHGLKLPVILESLKK